MTFLKQTDSGKFFEKLNITDFEDYGIFEITRVEGDARNFELQCHVVLDEDFEFHRMWLVECHGVRKSTLRVGGFGQTRTEEQHVLLSEFQETVSRLGFRGRTDHPASVVGSLYDAHRKLSEGWVPFHSYFGNRDVLELIQGGFGVLAEGPASFISLYEGVLKQFGIETSRTGEREPAEWDGKSYDPFPKLNALLLDDCFIVAEKFNAKMI